MKGTFPLREYLRPNSTGDVYKRQLSSRGVDIFPREPLVAYGLGDAQVMVYVPGSFWLASGSRLSRLEPGTIGGRGSIDGTHSHSLAQPVLGLVRSDDV